MATIRAKSSYISGNGPRLLGFGPDLLGSGQSARVTVGDLALTGQVSTTGLDHKETGSGIQHVVALNQRLSCRGDV